MCAMFWISQQLFPCCETGEDTGQKVGGSHTVMVVHCPWLLIVLTGDAWLSWALSSTPFKERVEKDFNFKYRDINKKKRWHISITHIISNLKSREGL